MVKVQNLNMATRSSNKKWEQDGTLKRLVFGTGSMKRQKKKFYDEVNNLTNTITGP